MELRVYINQLKEHTLKVTPKRKAVIELLLKQKKYLSPLEVWSLLKRKFSPLGLPTIYRILEELHDIGMLTRIQRKNRQLYYFLCETPKTIHHHHFICVKCRKIEMVEYCNFKSISRIIERKLNCKTETHSLQIEGLCSQCK
jgi:Fur family ferric uptake transcriptional regulator